MAEPGTPAVLVILLVAEVQIQIGKKVCARFNQRPAPLPPQLERDTRLLS
jgi:hypothetical protein